MKVKKEYNILILAIVALSAYLLTRQRDKTHYQLPALPEVAAKEITKIEIAGPERTLELKKEGGVWVVGPKAYACDEETIDKMLDTIGKLTVTALVSESKNYDRYDLHPDAKITVKAWAGDQLKREFDLGKAASTYRHTFVKLSSDDRVFHARDNFRDRFDSEIDDLRDKTVMKLKREGINEIQLRAAGETKVVSRKTPEVPEKAEVKEKGEQADKKEKEAQPADAPAKEPEPGWQKADGTPMESDTMNSLLGALSELRCSSYIYDKKKQELGEPLYAFTIRGAEDATLSIFAKLNEDDSEYPAASSQSDEPFLLSAWAVDNMLEKLDVKPEEKKTEAGLEETGIEPEADPAEPKKAEVEPKDAEVGEIKTEIELKEVEAEYKKAETELKDAKAGPEEAVAKPKEAEPGQPAAGADQTKGESEQSEAEPNHTEPAPEPSGAQVEDHTKS